MTGPLCLFLLATTATPEANDWQYRAKVLEGGDLGVEAQFPSGTSTRLELPRRSRPFLTQLELAPREGGRFRGVDLEAEASECAQGCRIRYRFALARATEALRGVAGSAHFDGGLMTSTSLWLLHPEDAPDGARYHLRFEPSPGQVFVSGLSRSGPLTFTGPAEHVSPSPFAVLGALTIRRYTFGDRAVELAYPPGRFAVGDAAIERWVGASLTAVNDYYGRFPVPYALVVLVPIPGHETGRATAMGFGGASVRLELGARMTQGELDQVWELIHELTHLSLANLGPDRHWLEEGLATYLEPIIRVRAGMISPERYWRDLQVGLPNGLPTPSSRGFDGTRSWGETYWGGALYFFLADLQIRRATQGQRSLDDALAAIVAAGLDLRVYADVEEVLAVGDRATGTTTLLEFYRQVARRPYPVELEELWKRLGVRRVGEVVSFDPAAPEGALRTMITRGPKRPSTNGR